jgi:hypothetical protein
MVVSGQTATIRRCGPMRISGAQWEGIVMHLAQIVPGMKSLRHCFIDLMAILRPPLSTSWYSVHRETMWTMHLMQIHNCFLPAA